MLPLSSPLQGLDFTLSCISCFLAYHISIILISPFYFNFDFTQVGTHINAFRGVDDTGKSIVEDLPLSHPDLRPVWRECERLGACVMVHPWDMEWCEAGYVLIRYIELFHGYLSIPMCRGFLSRAPIEWCIGEPIPVFFYRILQCTIPRIILIIIYHYYNNIIT